jgi:hypothetical protein
MQAEGTFKTVVLGLVTFGFLPLLLSRRRWLQQMEIERHLVSDALDVLPLSASEINDLRRDSARLNQQWFAAVLIGLSLVAVIWFFLLWLGQENFSIPVLLASTYKFHPRMLGNYYPWKRDLYIAWTLGLSLAYLAQWAAVQWHVTRMQHLAKKLNPLLQTRGRAPIPMPQIGVGVSVRSIIGAAVMVLLGALWGIPMMLMAAAQRQYARRTAPQWRAAFSQPLPLIPLAGSPMTRAPICPNPRCQKSLPPSAAFCPRCGQKIS